MRYLNRNVFVAGGTSGINLGIACAFAVEGANVGVLSRSKENVDSAVDQLEAISQKAAGYVGDVRDYVAIETVVRQFAELNGPIDIVVSGAAGNFLCPAEQLSSNGFKTVVDIDLLGTFNVLRAAWPHLRKPGAAIVNITAAQSWLPMPLQVHACSAKAGVDQVTRTLAAEWGKDGVRVNAVAPGPIQDTEGMSRLAASRSSADAWKSAVPLGRWGTRDDISAAVLWLCSQEASYVTGVVLPVDGGLSLGGSSAVVAAMRS